jgi:hypothetical protein
MAAGGENRWPYLGRNRWPLTGAVAEAIVDAAAACILRRAVKRRNPRAAWHLVVARSEARC